MIYLLVVIIMWIYNVQIQVIQKRQNKMSMMSQDQTQKTPKLKTNGQCPTYGNLTMFVLEYYIILY